MDSSPSLAPLFRFIGSPFEVRGRQGTLPPDSIRDVLLEFLDGKKLDKALLKATMRELRVNPAWVDWFADQIKSRRSSS